MPQLQQDQVLRGYLQLIDATVRTNYFQVDADGRHSPGPGPQAGQLRRSRTCPPPGPRSRRSSTARAVEGIHLRAGSDRPGRAAVERAAHGLPHRGPGPGVRPGQEERHHRPDRGQGRLRVRRRRPSGAGAGPDPDEVRAAYEMFVRALLDITDNLVVGPGRHPAAGGGLGRPRPLSGRRGRQGHGDVLRPGQLPQRGVRVLAGRRLRVRGVPRLRPQGHGHHRPGRLGGGAPPLPSARDRRPDRSDPGGRRRRHVRRRVRQRHAAQRDDPPGRRVRPPPRVPRPRPRSRDLVRRAARLAALPRSSWADYRPELISEGGGVWPRNAKTMPLAPAAQRALGVAGRLAQPARS